MLAKASSTTELDRGFNRFSSPDTECLRNFENIGDEVAAVQVVLEEPLFICHGVLPIPKKIKVPTFWEHTFLRRKSVTLTCPNCLQAVETMICRRSTKTTHLLALILLPICLCMVPYFMKETRTTIHRCPSCDVYLGACLASAEEGLVILCSAHHANDFED